MAIDVATFRIRFPEYADIVLHPDARIQLFLDDAVLCVDEDCWGQWHELGVYNLAAHEYALRYDATTGNVKTGSSAGSAGALKSKTVDKVSGSYGFQDVDLEKGYAYYMTTPYGRKYWNLFQKVRPGCAFMVLRD
jgi:hypothetical protein